MFEYHKVNEYPGGDKDIDNVRLSRLQPVEGRGVCSVSNQSNGLDGGLCGFCFCFWFVYRERSSDFGE